MYWWLRNQKLKKVVFASSCAVYGDAETMPVVETSPLNPKSPYAAGKLACEYYNRNWQGWSLFFLGKPEASA